MHRSFPSAFLVTVEDREVGLAIARGNGLKFVAMDPDYQLLDGSRFPRLEQVVRAAQRLAMSHRGPGRKPVERVPAENRSGCDDGLQGWANHY
jgi:hypothetical protein